MDRKDPGRTDRIIDIVAKADNCDMFAVCEIGRAAADRSGGHIASRQGDSIHRYIYRADVDAA